MQVQRVFFELGCADLNVSAMWRYESCSNQNGMTTQLEKKRVNRSATYKSLTDIVFINYDGQKASVNP